MPGAARAIEETMSQAGQNVGLGAESAQIWSKGGNSLVPLAREGEQPSLSVFAPNADVPKLEIVCSDGSVMAADKRNLQGFALSEKMMTANPFRPVSHVGADLTGAWIADFKFERAKMLFSQLPAEKDATILEIGCSDGTPLPGILRRDIKYTGIDVDAESLKSLTAKFRPSGTTFATKVADAKELPITSNSQDYVYTSNTGLLLVPITNDRTILDIAAASPLEKVRSIAMEASQLRQRGIANLSEVARVLKPGGKFITEGWFSSLHEVTDWEEFRRQFRTIEILKADDGLAKLWEPFLLNGNTNPLAITAAKDQFRTLIATK
ncbi:MAG: class I SAM-dependent methyltransferase [Candidatus Melainabacteria bacterium]|nr:MAG: class I SAM-dependent methyltransferase [Candidatus Melainabacteria bacterium]